MQQDRISLYKSLKYCAKNDELFKTALTHRSANSLNNERLEFLGDSILNFLIAKFLLEKFPNASEGQLSNIRSNLVCENMLAKIAMHLGIHNCLYLGMGEIKTGGNRRKSILADALEACIAAIYLDSSMEECEIVIKYIYQNELLDLTLEISNKDYKTQLQELLQAKKSNLPTYNIVETKGDAHNHTFYIECRITNPAIKAIGQGKTKRQAEQEAAKKILTMIEKYEPIEK